MSPEQWAGVGVTYKTDIYAYGCMLYEAIDRKTPFSLRNDINGLRVAHLLEKPDLFTTALAALNPAVTKLLGTMLEKDQSLRPSWAEVIKTLDHAFPNFFEKNTACSKNFTLNDNPSYISGIYKLNLSNYLGARTDFNSIPKAERLEPYYTINYIKILSGLKDLQSLKEALEFFSSTFDEGFTSAVYKVYYLEELSNYYRLTGQLELAIKFASEGIKFSPSYPSCYFKIVAALVESKRIAEAEKFVLIIIERFDDDAKAMGFSGWFYRFIKDEKKAQPCLLKAFELDPYNDFNARELAGTYMASDSFLEAIKILKISIKSSVANCNTFAKLGVCYFKINQFYPAYENMLKASLLDPANERYFLLTYDYAKCCGLPHSKIEALRLDGIKRFPNLTSLKNNISSEDSFNVKSSNRLNHNESNKNIKTKSIFSAIKNLFNK